VLLIATGVQIRYAGLVELMSFKTAVVAHNWIGFVLIANFFVWLLFYLFTDKIKVYHPDLSPMRYYRATLRQMQFYGYGIFRGEPNPYHVSAYHKFNPLQSMMYQIVMMLLVPIQFFTGVLLWDVGRFSSMVEALGGVRVVDTIHVLLFIFFSGFIIVHIYLGCLGHTPSAHYKAMITGFEEVDGHGAPAEKDAAVS
jgi:thiosulfate reductase cytochrome b subunit